MSRDVYAAVGIPLPPSLGGGLLEQLHTGVRFLQTPLICQFCGADGSDTFCCGPLKGYVRGFWLPPAIPLYITPTVYLEVLDTAPTKG
jgi:hypothetical protein